MPDSTHITCLRFLEFSSIFFLKSISSFPPMLESKTHLVGLLKVSHNWNLCRPEHPGRVILLQCTLNYNTTIQKSPNLPLRNKVMINFPPVSSVLIHASVVHCAKVILIGFSWTSLSDSGQRLRFRTEADKTLQRDSVIHFRSWAISPSKCQKEAQNWSPQRSLP